MARALAWPSKLGDAFNIRIQTTFCKTSGGGSSLNIDKINKSILLINPLSNAFLRYNSNVQFIRQIILSVNLKLLLRAVS